MVEKVFLYLYEMAYHYRKSNHSMKSQTIVMCCKNTKFVENCVCDMNWRHFNFIDFSSVEIWTLFAKPIIALLYVPVQWWFSLVKCAITCVCLVFSAYRSYCTRIYQTKELGQLRGPSKLLVKIKNPAADFIQVEPCSD